jgi:hypothetical protein
MEKIRVLTTPSRNPHQPRHAISPPRKNLHIPTFDRVVAVESAAGVILPTAVVDPYVSGAVQHYDYQTISLPPAHARRLRSYWLKHLINPPPDLQVWHNGFDYTTNCHHMALEICGADVVPLQLVAVNGLMRKLIEYGRTVDVRNLPDSGTHLAICTDTPEGTEAIHSVVVTGPAEGTVVQLTACGGYPSVVNLRGWLEFEAERAGTDVRSTNVCMIDYNEVLWPAVAA